MRIKTNSEYNFTTKLLRVYRKAINLQKSSLVKNIMLNAFYYDSFFVGVEKLQFVELHSLAIERGCLK